MNCRNCGTYVREGAVFCPNCGANVVSFYNDHSQTMPTPKKRRYPAIIAICLVLAIVIIVSVFFASNFFEKGYETIAKNSVNAYIISENLDEISEYYICDYAEYKKRLIEIAGETEREYFDYYSDKGVYSVEDYKEYWLDNNREENEFTYGEYTVSTDVIYSQKLTDEDCEDILDNVKEEGNYDIIEDIVDFDKIDYNNVYDVILKSRIEGTKKKVERYSCVLVVKYGNEWKVVPRMNRRYYLGWL